MVELISNLVGKNELVFAFLFVGVVMWLSYWVSRRFLSNRIPGAAIAITAGLMMAYLGDGKGIADIPLFAGVGILGGSMFRDFTIVATAVGVDIDEIKKAGIAGVVALLLGILVAFFLGGTIGYAMGYQDAVSFTTIGAGACTYVVGPVTGAALGAESEVIAISIAIGVIKTIFTTIVTPLVAKRIQLDNPNAAMVFGGLIGTTSGVAAGLAATDPKLVPYGALTATFYTGIGVLLCPSIFYFIVSAIL